MIRRLFLVFAFSLLAACQSMDVPGMGSPNPNMFDRTYLRENIRPGVTTVADVQRLFGNPTSRTDGPRGPEYWAYSEIKLQEGGYAMLTQAMGALGLGSPVADGAIDKTRKSRDLSIHFENNVVTSYGLSE